MLGGERLERRDRLLSSGRSRGQQRLGAILAGGDAQLFQPDGLRSREVVGELGVGGTVPLGQGLVEEPDGRCRPRLGRAASSNCSNRTASTAASGTANR